MSSVCLSVTLVDQHHIGWKSWKLIARAISPTPSLFVAQRPSTDSLSQRKLGGDYRDEVEKSGVLEHKSGNISETRKDRGKFTMDSLQEVTNALSNCTIPDPYGLPFPRSGVRNPTPKLQSLLCQQRLKLRTANLADTFTGSIRTQAHEKF